MRRLLPLTLLFAVLGGLAFAASPASAAKDRLNVGIANQEAEMFRSPFYKALDMKRTRYLVRWNAIDDEDELARIDHFVNVANANDVDVLMHITAEVFDPDNDNLPSQKEYKKKVGALVDRYYEKGVREWGVWNEANDRNQPTQGHADRAAEYFMEMWRMLDDKDKCGRPLTEKCRIVALDLLDGRSDRLRRDVRKYIREFYDRLNNKYDSRARFIGLHNYSDTNRHGRNGTKNVIKEIRRHTNRERIWLTETGGIVKLGDSGDFTCDPDDPEDVKDSEEDAEEAIAWMFRLAKDYRNSIDRLYIYKWTGSDCKDDFRFDSGLTRANGAPRPAYFTVERQLRKSDILKP